jgi:hypothetical protein
MKGSAKWASGKVGRAVRRGELIRPSVCQTCGVDVTINKDWWRDRKRLMTVAHHWRGYSFPLDVWWVCYSCNTRLAGLHDGLTSLDEAGDDLRLAFGRALANGDIQLRRCRRNWVGISQHLGEPDEPRHQIRRFMRWWAMEYARYRGWDITFSEAKLKIVTVYYLPQVPA